MKCKTNDMKIKCNSCGYEQKALMPEKTPKGTVRIESNFCHKCDGDYYEEEHFDKDGKIINTD